MNKERSQVLEGGRRYPASSGRIALLGLGIACLYAAGLGCGGWAATLSLASVRAGGDVPWLPWLGAFFFMVSGMLAVVYGFFFRPRAVEVNDQEVALVKWDGKAKSLLRGDFVRITSSRSSIVLEGKSGSLVIPGKYDRWEALRAELSGWSARPLPRGLE